MHSNSPQRQNLIVLATAASLLFIYNNCTSSGFQPQADESGSGASTSLPGIPTASPTGTPPPVISGLFFPASELWYHNVTQDPVDARSAAIIPFFNSLGWGTGKFQAEVNGAFHILLANNSTPRVSFVEDSPGPDCDSVSSVPLPVGGAIEGESGYSCTQGGDCHLLVADLDAKLLYEVWEGNMQGGVMHGSCMILWKMDENYWPANDTSFLGQGRGDQCTSADAAGFPISPLLATADQMYQAIQSGVGDLGHALRFILPNSTMAHATFIHPASHAGGPSNTNANAIPYGARLRLKPGFDLTKLPNEASRVIARTLQRYGMYLADGGNIAMNFEDDAFDAHKWSEFGIQQLDLQIFTPSDFEMLKGGPAITLTYDCVRVK